jgi:hypothetical protein
MESHRREIESHGLTMPRFYRLVTNCVAQP